jgi:hypothetical protein
MAAAALREIESRRSRQWASGQDWTGYKHVRVFQGVAPGDLATHRAAELAPGAVLPAKWGGVATARAIDPRLTLAPEAGQKASAQTEIYTEWTELITITGFVADFWTPYEMRPSGNRVGTLQQFQGSRTCIILDSEIGSLSPYYNVALGADHPFPGATGSLAAHLVGYRLGPMAERPLCSRLTLLYADRTPIQALEPGRAILEVKVSGHTVKRQYDDNGDVIEGPDAETADADAKWVLVEGSNIVLEPGATVRITTAAATTNVPLLWSKIGKINSNTFSNVGNAPAGTMKFLGATVSGQLINRKYWGLSYDFEYRPLRADNTTAFGGGLRSLKYTKRAVTTNVKIKDSTGNWVNDGTKTTQMTIWEPAANGSEPRTLNPGSADFSDLNGMLGWL